MTLAACTMGGSGPELWKRACDPGPVPADAPPDQRAMVYSGVIDCRATFAHMGAIDGKTTDAIARCVISLRDQPPSPDEAEDALFECLPKRRRDAARELIEEAQRFQRERHAGLDATPEREPLSVDELMHRVEEQEAAAETGSAPAADRPRSRGEDLLARETRPSLDLAQAICGAVPPKQPPYDVYVRASLQRSTCRDQMAQLIRSDERGALLIAVCVLDQESGEVPFEPASLEQLYECVPEQAHERVDKFIWSSKFWKKPDDGVVEALLETVEAELADGERGSQPL